MSPHPSAPMLKAEYQNHYGDAQYNDYYGGFEPQSTGTYPRAANTGPLRHEPPPTKEPRRCCCRQSNPVSTVQFINVMIIFRTLMTLAFICLLIYSGVRQEFLLYYAAFDVISLLASLMLCCGISAIQPFVCIPFVVLRTMEAFVCLCLCLALGTALYDVESESFLQMHRIVHETSMRLPKMNIDVRDFAYQVAMLLLIICFFCFALAFHVCRIAWAATMSITDEYRRKRTFARSNNDMTRVMVASDELYTNY